MNRCQVYQTSMHHLTTLLKRTWINQRYPYPHPNGMWVGTYYVRGITMKQVIEQLKVDMPRDKVVFLDIDGVIGDTWQIRDATSRGQHNIAVTSYTRGEKE